MSEPQDPPPPPPPFGYTPPPPPGFTPEQAQGAGGFSVGAAFGWGWKKFQENLGPLIIATLAIVGVGIVVGILRVAVNVGAQTTVDPNTGRIESPGFFGAALFFGLFLGLVQWIVSLVVSAGITKGSLEIADGRPLELGTMFKGFDIVQVVIASVLTGLGVIIGLLLCVLPGIIFAFLTSFTTYFIVDQKQSAVDAIKSSIAFTRQRVGDVILLFLAMFVAFILGACACLVGLLVTIPVAVLAQAYAFRKLNGQAVAP
jgi:uncharacterized membrane protein